MSEALPRTQRDLLALFTHARIPMARNRLDLFRLLGHFRPDEGWDKFVSRIDFTGVTPSHIYQVVLGRSPEKIQVLLTELPHGG